MLVYFLITLICVHGSQIVEACRHCNRPRHRDEPNINLPDGVGVADQQWCKAEKESVLENHTALSDNKIEPKDVIFMFYARNDQRSPVKVRIINDTLYPEPVTFNSSKHTVLFLPAEQKSYSDVAGKLREGLANLDVNLIVVNWDKHAYDSPEYTRYITIPRLGNIVSDFTKMMIEEKKSDPKTMYFIGSGLGGQAIGVAGHKLLPNAVARMLAIDPIDSCYGYENPDKRLSIGDANHIATMYCTLGSRGTSLDFIRGDATFFINGGKVQPSCTTFAHGSAHQINGCSRNLCENYFFESLQDGKLFAGAKCSSYEQYETSPKKCDFRRSECMGFFSQRKADGLYFVDITDRRSRVQKHVPKCRTYCDFSWF